MMALRDVPRPSLVGPIPTDIRAFLREADKRIRRYYRRSRKSAFVPCNFGGAYRILQHLAAQAETPGTLFCEWGSGFGVVTCLAALLEFDAYGIEVDSTLVRASRRLAADFDLVVEFAEGSFIPAGDRILMRAAGSFAWLTTTEPPVHEELGLATQDFGIIFAYPWPDEERALSQLFERHAAAGALLVTHHGGEDFRLRRKSG
jgi:hypothetical protein